MGLINNPYKTMNLVAVPNEYVPVLIGFVLAWGIGSFVLAPYVYLSGHLTIAASLFVSATVLIALDVILAIAYTEPDIGVSNYD